MVNIPGRTPSRASASIAARATPPGSVVICGAIVLRCEYLIRGEFAGKATLDGRILVFLAEEAIAYRENVNVGRHEAREGFLRGADNRLMRTLKLVFTSTGQPVRSLKAESKS